MLANARMRPSDAALRARIAADGTPRESGIACAEERVLDCPEEYQDNEGVCWFEVEEGPNGHPMLFLTDFGAETKLEGARVEPQKRIPLHEGSHLTIAGTDFIVRRHEAAE